MVRHFRATWGGRMVERPDPERVEQKPPACRSMWFNPFRVGFKLLDTVGFAPPCCAQPAAIHVGLLRGQQPAPPSVSGNKLVGHDQPPSTGEREGVKNSGFRQGTLAAGFPVPAPTLVLQ